MPAHTQAHIQTAPPAMTEAELDLARWEDDGGPAFEPPCHPHAGEWLRIAAALSERLPELAGREDVLVTCEIGTRSGAPAAFYPTAAQLEIDAALFAPLSPPTIDPLRPGDEDRYPAAWGAFTHEAAHAAHSRWITPPPLRGTALDAAGAVLEESRAERAHLGRRPGDRRYLRAAVTTLVLKDFTSQPLADRWQAAMAAGLLLARRDAGILDPDETASLESTVTGILGADLLETLAAIWTASHTTGDEDGQTMLEHARAWCTALGTDPAGPEPAPDPDGEASTELAEAIGKTVSTVAANEAMQAAAQARIDAARTARKQAKAAQAAQARQAAQTAEKVFGSGGRPHTPGKPGRGQRGRSPVIDTRPPTGAEKAAAGQLARALRAAAYRERTTTHAASTVPPGRLNMRQALARDAQRAAGAVPTATPWTRTVHRSGPTPPLRVGIAVDVSGSMDIAAAPIASAAWIVAKAVSLTDPDSRSATVAYDRSVTAITAPGRTPRAVTRFAAEGMGHSLAEATDALTAGVDLTQPGAGRLLVIASDGYYTTGEAARAAERLTALRAAGCAVLWLAFDPDPRPLPGATVLELTHPAQAATAIGKAATAALAAAQP
ncbi:VWA domain-containing protein [Streptomyces sp. S07_1.15]|uniref:VWA domain-containing protein n=1 Tax=Streptomyces sp. S07_1.15 TaxID=2873925 RepID=UPI001D14816F|nr:vWA domain-containing protein [Streptomyces sp. S07_1.15]MCC3654021.1 VWA domain-containing protein [Streptomyces sp. S07_1.15]